MDTRFFSLHGEYVNIFCATPGYIHCYLWFTWVYTLLSVTHLDIYIAVCDTPGYTLLSVAHLKYIALLSVPYPSKIRLLSLSHYTKIKLTWRRRGQ